MPSTDILPPPMFDLEVPGLSTDGPGARRGDPLSSRVAADRVEGSKPDVKTAVLSLIAEHGELTGRELNDLYRAVSYYRGWRAASYESPRKRAEELVKAGRLNVLNQDAVNHRGVPALYTLLGVRS